jgi:hypothetical protein
MNHSFTKETWAIYDSRRDKYIAGVRLAAKLVKSVEDARHFDKKADARRALVFRIPISIGKMLNGQIERKYFPDDETYAEYANACTFRSSYRTAPRHFAAQKIRKMYKEKIVPHAIVVSGLKLIKLSHLIMAQHTEG